MPSISSTQVDPDRLLACTQVGDIGELLERVVGYLSGKSLLQASGVCKKWRKASHYHVEVSKDDCGLSVEYPFTRTGLSQYAEELLRAHTSVWTSDGDQHQVELDTKQISQLGTWNNMVKHTPNLRTVSNYPVRDHAYARVGIEHKGSLQYDPENPGSWILLVPAARNLSVIRNAAVTIPSLTPSKLGFSFALSARRPKNQQEADQWTVALKNPLPRIHAIHTPPGWQSLLAFDGQELDAFLSDIATKQRSAVAGSPIAIQSISITVACTSENKSIKPYADSAATMRKLWKFGPGGVRALTFRSFEPNPRGNPDLRLTDQSFFESPQFADGLEDLRLEVSRGQFPMSTKLPSSLKNLTLAYRLIDLPQGDHVDALASCVGMADLTGSLALRIECSDPGPMRTLEVENKCLEVHRLRREKEYNDKLQDGSLLPPIEEAACVELLDDPSELTERPSAVSQDIPHRAAAVGHGREF